MDIPVQYYLFLKGFGTSSYSAVAFTPLGNGANAILVTNRVSFDYIYLLHIDLVLISPQKY
jgi:hypothetical protein